MAKTLSACLTWVALRTHFNINTTDTHICMQPKCWPDKRPPANCTDRVHSIKQQQQATTSDRRALHLFVRNWGAEVGEGDFFFGCLCQVYLEPLQSRFAGNQALVLHNGMWVSSANHIWETWVLWVSWVSCECDSCRSSHDMARNCKLIEQSVRLGSTCDKEEPQSLVALMNQ